MENLFFTIIVVIVILILIFAKKFFFAKACERLPEKTIQKKDIEFFYKLNTNSIKLSLYDSRIFVDFYIANAYKSIIIKNLWIDEPFLTNFSKILYLIDSNNFWIKSPKTKSIVINLRGIDGKEFDSTSFKVLSIKEVVGHTVMDVFKKMHGKIKKKTLQNILLNSLIFVLAKSDNIQDFLDNDVSKSHDEIIYELLVKSFFENSSEDFKMNLLEIGNSYHNSINKIYLQNLQYAQEYAYTTSEYKCNENILLKLGNIPKKQLLSIK